MLLPAFVAEQFENARRTNPKREQKLEVSRKDKALSIQAAENYIVTFVNSLHS